MKFWDTMAKRYSCPDFLLDGYIAQKQLSRFIHEAWSLYQEDYLWEFWLAKVNNGKSFNDFRAGISKKSDSMKKSSERPSEEEIRAIIEQSKNITTSYTFEDSR